MKILAIRGVLDSSTGHRFERSLTELLREHQEPIGLDFSGLKYMTSAGVASFLRISQKAQERNLALGILNPSQEVAMMLDFLGISKHIPVYDSEEQMRQAMPESRQPLYVVEQQSFDSAPSRPHANPAGSSVRGGLLPPEHYAGASGNEVSSASSSVFGQPVGSGGSTSPGSAPSYRGGDSGGAPGSLQSSVGQSRDAYYMGESIGRLSETLNGLTRHLKSLGKTMEDLQRTEHSLKEEFEQERRLRASSGRVRSAEDRQFHFSDGSEQSSASSQSAASGQMATSGPATARGSFSGEAGGRLASGARPGSAGPGEVPVASMQEQASAASAAHSRASSGIAGSLGGKVSGPTSGATTASANLAGPRRGARQAAASEINRIIQCEQCGSKLRIYHTGRHLCPACKIEFEVETDGSTSYYEKLATS